jgi:hypothetical protein
MNPGQVFILADRALENVVKQIKPEHWDLKVPDDMSPRQPGSTLRQIVNYHAYDEAFVPETLAGKTIAEVGDKYDGDLLGDDPAAGFSRIVDATVAVVEKFTDFDKNVHLSYGDFPAGEYLKHITSFRGFRAYDIAKFIGAGTKLPDDLVQGMWDEFAPEIEQWRAMGVFGPAVQVPETADLQSRLLGLAGRNPQS